jgi:hypothetical protein
MGWGEDKGESQRGLMGLKYSILMGEIPSQKASD